MTTIREKIMAIEHPLPWDGWPHNGPFLIEAFERGLHKAADIAEAEVARLEARVRELEEALKLAADALEIANDWNLHDVQIDPPKEWGLYAEQEDSADGWCSTQALSNKLRELAERVIGGE